MLPHSSGTGPTRQGHFEVILGPLITRTGTVKNSRARTDFPSQRYRRAARFRVDAECLATCDANLPQCIFRADVWGSGGEFVRNIAECDAVTTSAKPAISRSGQRENNSLNQFEGISKNARKCHSASEPKREQKMLRHFLARIVTGQTPHGLQGEKPIWEFCRRVVTRAC